MRKLFAALLIACGFAIVVVAANWLILASSGKVEPGVLRADALATLGEPATRVGPVGDPAVERWSYPDGTQVVLLGNRVVDSFIEVH